ncbi:acyl carrier protein [Salmonella enterica subsp. enterica serovar Poona]|nr:acyl carrier protein [Salmonella enterica subsp. enterica serovar Poona]
MVVSFQRIFFVENTVKQIIAKCLLSDKSKITSDTHLVEDLHVDSLELIDIIMTINETFGTDIDGVDFPEVETVRGLCRVLKRKLTE